MSSRAKGAMAAVITLTLIPLILCGSLIGCGGKVESEQPAAGETEAGKRADSASQDSQPQNYVFSATASADTKTETFQVTTSSQVLHYNVIGGEDATVTITVYSYPEGKMQAGANTFEPGPHEKTIYLTPGTYYMEILPDNCTVEVKVQD